MNRDPLVDIVAGILGEANLKRRELRIRNGKWAGSRTMRQYADRIVSLFDRERQIAELLSRSPEPGKQLGRNDSPDYWVCALCAGPFAGKGQTPIFAHADDCVWRLARESIADACTALPL